MANLSGSSLGEEKKPERKRSLSSSGTNNLNSSLIDELSNLENNQSLTVDSSSLNSSKTTCLLVDDLYASPSHQLQLQPAQAIEEITLSSMVKNLNENLKKAKREKREMEAAKKRKRHTSTGGAQSKIKNRRSSLNSRENNEDMVDMEEDALEVKRKAVHRLSMPGNEEIMERRVTLKRKASITPNDESETEKESQDGATSLSGSTCTADPQLNDSENSET